MSVMYLNNRIHHADHAGGLSLDDGGIDSN